MGGGRGPGGAGAARGAGGGNRGGAGGDRDLGRVLEALRQQNAQQQRLLQALEGGGGGGRGAQAQRQRGASATSSSDNGSGAANANGGWRRGGGKGGGGSTRARPGDWTCPACGAYPCFAATSRCFKCRAPRRDRPGGAAAARENQEGGGGGGTGKLSGGVGPSTYLGPVGAGGSRPLLGGRANGSGKVDNPPSFRVPGASSAARAEEMRAQRAPVITAEARGDAGDGNNGGDKEFQVVQKGRGAKPAAMQGNNPAPTLSTSKSWAALAEEEDDDDCDIDDDGGGCDGAHGDDDAEWSNLPGQGAADNQVADEVSEGQLKNLWISHCTAVKTLERDKSVLPEVLASVRQQRDAAERRWKAAKTPHPLHKRLRWAENDLRAAVDKEDVRRRELALHLEQTAARTREIEERLAIDIARTQRKRDALATIQREASLGSCEGAERAARVAVAGIASDIGPSLAAIIERLGDGDEAIRQDLQIISTSLGRVEGVLRDAAEAQLAARGPERFNIGGGDGKDDGDSREDDGGHGDMGDGSGDGGRRVQARTDSIASAPRWTQPAANAPWRRLPSSHDAVEQARRLLQGDTSSGTGIDTTTATSAETNDLAVAERRRQCEAQSQFAAALDRRQALQDDPAQAQQEEQMRKQREQAQRDELLRHQNAAAKAAADAAAEDVRQKEALWASLSPAEREAAIKVRSQQAAVGAHVFGTQEASQLAGLVHQSHVHERACADADAAAADVDFLMQMSPEEFARWDNERQSLL